MQTCMCACVWEDLRRYTTKHTCANLPYPHYPNCSRHYIARFVLGGFFPSPPFTEGDPLRVRISNSGLCFSSPLPNQMLRHVKFVEPSSISYPESCLYFHESTLHLKGSFFFFHLCRISKCFAEREGLGILAEILREDDGALRYVIRKNMPQPCNQIWLTCSRNEHTAVIITCILPTIKQNNS